MAFEPVLTKGIGELDLVDIEVYEKQGGYQALRKALSQMTPEDVHAEVKKANLRGRGGAGFPAGVKWGFLPDDGRPRYLCCNADESEPGTFNNKMLIEYNPHLLIEGIFLAAYAAKCAQSFIYIRGEFKRGYRFSSKRSPRRRRKGTSARTSSAPDSPRTSPSTAGRAPTSVARRPACSARSRAAGANPGSSPRSRRCRGFTACRRSSTTSRPCATYPLSSTAAPTGSCRSALKRARAPRFSRSADGAATRQLRTPVGRHS